MKKLILMLTVVSLLWLMGVALAVTADRIAGPATETNAPQKSLTVARPGATPEIQTENQNRLQNPINKITALEPSQTVDKEFDPKSILLFDSTIPSINDIPATPAPETPLLVPVNDNCADVMPVALTPDAPVTFTGNNAGATPDCPYLGPPEVWEAITIDQCMDITIEYCGSTPIFRVVFNVITASCPCGTLIPFSGSSWYDCPDFNATLRFGSLAPGTYYIPIASFGPSVGDYNIRVTGYACPPAGPNDNCSDAIAIGDVSNLRFTTAYATFDGPGGCMTSPNIWYVYTASCTGNATVSLLNSTFDTELAIYDGASCDPIGNMIACNDNYGSLQSQIIFPAVSGQQYLIEVGGAGASVGNGWLSTSCALKPPNDDCTAVTPTLLEPGTPLVFNGTNVGASNDCPLNGSNYPEVWEAITTNVCMDVTIDYCGTAPVFGNVFGVINSGCPCASLIYSSSMFQECPDGNWVLHFIGLPAGTYYIPILDDPSHGFDGPYTMNVSGVACPQAPPNDNCVDVVPEPLNIGSTLTFSGDNTGATSDCPALGTPEVWHAFTINECMNVTVDYCGSEQLFSQYFVVLADACPCGGLIFSYQYNFFDCPDGRPTFKYANLQPGTYYLPVFTDANAMGPYIINVNGVACPPPPENDECAGAIDISIPSTTLGTTLGANYDDAPICYTTIWSVGVWYRLIGNGNLITATTCAEQTDYNSIIDVYSGVCGDFVCVAGNDDNCSLPAPRNTSSTATFCSELGVEYYILVQGQNGDRGSFQLDISEGSACTPPPPVPVCSDESIFGQSPTGPGGMFNFLNSDTSATPDPYTVYDNFSGLTDDICSIRFWGLDVYYNLGFNECTEDPMTFRINFYDDNAGAPGEITNTYRVTLNAISTGLLYNDAFELKEYNATLSPCVTMPSGWISIQGVSVGGDVGNCWFMWANSNGGGDGLVYQNNNMLAEDMAFCFATGGGCTYVVGDANASNTFNGLDVTYSVGYFKGGPPPPYSCACGTHGTWFVAGDVNASCSFNGLDVTYMVSYFKGGPTCHPCADCPPALGILGNPIGDKVQPLK